MVTFFKNDRYILLSWCGCGDRGCMVVEWCGGLVMDVDNLAKFGPCRNFFTF